MKARTKRLLFYALAFFLVFVTAGAYVEFSSFAFGLGRIAIFVAIVDIVDKSQIKEFDIITELKNGNTAIAIGLLAVAVLFHGAFNT